MVRDNGECVPRASGDERERLDLDFRTPVTFVRADDDSERFGWSAGCAYNNDDQEYNVIIIIIQRWNDV